MHPWKKLCRAAGGRSGTARRRVALLAAAPLVLAAAVATVTAPSAQAAGLTQVSGFGTNPTNLRMFWYVPQQVASSPGLLVVNHSCQGTASYAYSMSAEYVSAADKYGFIIVFPEATRSGSCWDVHSSQALTRGGGSDPVGIMSMVDYVRARYPIDSSKIVVSGFSSGAMMTNVLAGLYPDVFKAGAAFSGVPATCFSTNNGSEWNGDCAQGKIVKSAQEWGNAVRGMYSGYNGSYPRMQLWHGATDTTLRYTNFGEAIKQWTNVHGVSQTPVSSDSPASGWTRTRYGSSDAHAVVEGMSNGTADHNLPLSGMLKYAVTFLGLDNSGPTPTTTKPTTSTSTTSQPPQQGVVLSSTFEGGTDSWAGRGAASVAASGSGRSGGALSVTGRTDAWNGAIRDVTSTLRTGQTYYIEAWARMASGASSESLNLAVERVSSGTTSYDHPGEAVSVSSGEWVRLSGSYTVPSDATGLQLYVEGNSTGSFLLDDVTVSTEPITTTTTTKPTTTTTTTSTSTTKTTKTTKSSTKKSTKTFKTKLITKCKTGKNGKKTCRTITRTVKADSAASCAAIAVAASWQGGYLLTVSAVSSSVPRLLTPAAAGVSSVLDAGDYRLVTGTGDPSAVGATCS